MTMILTNKHIAITGRQDTLTAEVIGGMLTVCDVVGVCDSSRV